ncbi:hypothetical protein [Proteiniclasticum sp.]|uniref:hypothetical protein n=1 Tax=Proteiniclasticum sp. TaxID=2053595 RepID=UPI00289F370B|nr:hypothetical protein [Proteiniclasticum sp.]
MKRKIPRRYRYKTPVRKPEPECKKETEIKQLKEIESELSIAGLGSSIPILRWSWTALGKLYLEVVND